MKTFWAIYSAIILSFIFSVPMSSADYWTNEPPIQIGEIELSPGETVCVDTEVASLLKVAEDYDTLHICTSSERDGSQEYLDTSLTTYWTVIKDGKIYDEIQDKAMAPGEPLKFTPKQPGEYAIEVYADDHPQEPKRNDDRTSTITATITVLKVDLEQTDDNSPLDPKNRMCSNAQKNYKDVEYNIKITPADSYTVTATIEGSADVTFKNGKKIKEKLKNGQKVKLVAPDDATGDWTLTAVLEQPPHCEAAISEKVFKFVQKGPNYAERKTSLNMIEGLGCIIDRSTNDHYDFSTHAPRFWPSTANFTTRIYGTFGVETYPSDLYQGKVSAKVTATLRARSWVYVSKWSEREDAWGVAFMQFRIYDFWETVRLAWYWTDGERKFPVRQTTLGEFIVGPDAKPWTINTGVEVKPTGEETGDVAHSCAQSIEIGHWCESGVKSEPLLLIVGRFEVMGDK